MRKLALGVSAVLLGMAILGAGLYGWALTAVDTSTTARVILWLHADVDDWQRFAARTVAASPEPVTFEPTGAELAAFSTLFVERDGVTDEVDLDDFLEDTESTALIVLRGDDLLLERYYNGSSREATQTSFSVAKSFVSTLVGIAIDEGLIGGVDDPVTDYVPELLDRDARFADITLHDLLTMSSGLRYEDLGAPWSDDAVTYYSPDLRATALSAPVAEAPGQEFLYNNYNPLLLGLVLERATGMPVAEYLETRLWQPMGAEADGSWSLDSDASGFEKMESGINGRALDFAKLGWVLAAEGMAGEHRVVPAEWVEQATAVDDVGDPAADYQYMWWVDVERDTFLAWGNHGQFIYVDPDTDVVVARMGREYGYDEWPETLADLADRVAAEVGG